MLKKITKLIIGILLAVTFVGCPNNEQVGSGTTYDNKITSLQTVIDSADENSTINLSEYTDITNYSATINKTVTINGSSTNLKNATLTVEKDATISGITNASVTASSSLGNGSLKIASSSLSSLNIQGGGINSIVIINVSVNEVTINKDMSADDAEFVRLCVDAATTIGKLMIESSTLLDVTNDTKADANKFNINLGTGNNICVALSKKMSLDTTGDQAKASFGADNSSDAEFFIIVKTGNKIERDFFNQVANKVIGNDFDPYKDGESDQFDFDNPITGDMHFNDKPQDNPPPPPTVYTVTFDANGGAWTSGDTTMDATIDENGRINKPADPTRTDYDFVYWYLVATETADVSFDFTKPVDDNITLKAKWAAKQQETPTIYNVHFDANGGTLAAGTLEDVTVDENKTVAKPADPTKDGNDFDGWYLVVDAAGTLADESYDFTMQVKANITLKAKWTEKQQETPTVQYRVHFDVNSGVWMASGSQDVSVDDNTAVTKPTDPTKSGFKFAGWYLVVDAAAGTLADASYDFTTQVKANITLQAKWTPIWTVTFDAGDGAWADNDNTKDVTVDDGEIVTAPATNPKREEYAFEGWHLMDSDGGMVDESYDFTTQVKADITLKAKWTPIWTVTFDAGDGAWADDNDKTKDVTVDDGATVTAPATNPELEEYDFEGWHLMDSDGGIVDVSYDFTTQVKANIMLKAKWTKRVTAAECSIDIQDGQFYIVMSSSTATSWTFDVSSDVGIDLSNYEFTGWESSLYKGSHKLGTEYGNISSNPDDNPLSYQRTFTLSSEDAYKLPEGTYQIRITADVAIKGTESSSAYHCPVSGTFEIEIAE